MDRLLTNRSLLWAQLKLYDLQVTFLITSGMQMSNNHAPWFNKINLYVILSYIECPCQRQFNWSDTTNPNFGSYWYFIFFQFDILHKSKKEGYIEITLLTFLNPISANPTKWSNILKQFVSKLPTNCLSVFGHFVKLALNPFTTEVDIV